MIDDKVAFFSTQNWDTESFIGTSAWREKEPRGDAPTRDFLYTSTDPQLIHEITTWFKVATGQPPTPSLIMAPFRSMRAFVLEALQKTQKTLEIYNQSIQDEQIVETLIALKKQGKVISLVMTQDSFNAGLKGKQDYNRQSLKQLAQAGVRIRLIPSFTFPYIHAKGFCVDGKTLILMSANLYPEALDKNHEFALTLQDPAEIQEFQRVFKQDFQRGEKFK